MQIEWCREECDIAKVVQRDGRIARGKLADGGHFALNDGDDPSFNRGIRKGENLTSEEAFGGKNGGLHVSKSRRWQVGGLSRSRCAKYNCSAADVKGYAFFRQKFGHQAQQV